MSASRLTWSASRAFVADRVAAFLLASLLLALAWAAGAARGTALRGALPAPWIVRAERLIGLLPISVSVAESGRLVYAHAGNLPRPPASNEKLLLSSWREWRSPSSGVAGGPPRLGQARGRT